MKKQETNSREAYFNATHRIGKISDIIAVLLILMVPVVITIVYGKGVKIQMSNTMSAIRSTCGTLFSEEQKAQYSYCHCSLSIVYCSWICLYVSTLQLFHAWIYRS